MVKLTILSNRHPHSHQELRTWVFLPMCRSGISFGSISLLLKVLHSPACVRVQGWGAAEEEKDVQDSSAEVIPEESLEDAVNVELQKVQQPWAPWAVGI